MMKQEKDWTDRFTERMERFSDRMQKWAERLAEKAEKSGRSYSSSTSQISQGGRNITVKTVNQKTTIKVDGKVVYSESK